MAILVSRGIAWFEYGLQMRADRIGSAALSTAEIKIAREVITRIVFAAFSIAFLGERVSWNYPSVICMLGAVARGSGGTVDPTRF